MTHKSKLDIQAGSQSVSVHIVVPVLRKLWEEAEALERKISFKRILK